MQWLFLEIFFEIEFRMLETLVKRLSGITTRVINALPTITVANVYLCLLKMVLMDHSIETSLTYVLRSVVCQCAVTSWESLVQLAVVSMSTSHEDRRILINSHNGDK